MHKVLRHVYRVRRHVWWYSLRSPVLASSLEPAILAKQSSGGLIPKFLWVFMLPQSGPGNEATSGE
jgi:hypothetical protein